MRRTNVLCRPDVLLRAEALLVLIASCTVYEVWFPHHWGLFALLFLVPDVSLTPSAFGLGRVAISTYNFVHSYWIAMLLGIASLLSQHILLGLVSVVWIAHIAFDRALGYGLKYPGSFKFTHLQRAGTGLSVGEAVAR